MPDVFAYQVKVFQSSFAKAQPSRHETRDRMEALQAANLLILVYTDSTLDWTYCMWECGVAINPSNPARVIVMTVGDGFPAIFADETRFQVRDVSDVQAFVDAVDAFLTRAEFFPGYPQPVAPTLQPNGPEILWTADELHRQLSAALERKIGVFISYRRQDTAPYARLLREELSKRFGSSRVFMDVESISGSADFGERIERAISTCKLVIVLIGPQWATITDSEGQRRLDDPRDLVRLEIEKALANRIPVMPVLVDDTSMPRPQQLPDSVAPMTRRNALALTHDRYSNDISHLLKEVGKIIG